MDADFVHLARFALAGRREDAAALVRRSLRDLTGRRPDLARQAKQLLEMVNGQRGHGVLRGGVPDPLPVDHDTRLELLRREEVAEILPAPVWTPEVQRQLDTVVEERQRAGELKEVGLTPTRSVLLVGPPGVGKTLAARWLSHELERPLMTLDLSAVMSSFLGRTGNNIRVVLDYARNAPSVLLLDEFDAIAKRRDDASEVGELKRLVTVLLQEVDEWSADSLLLAATNHPELLDPAVWRRFDRIIEFPMPSLPQVSQLIARATGDEANSSDLDLLAAALAGRSHAEIARSLTSARRQAFLQKTPLRDVLLDMAASILKPQALAPRLKIARILTAEGKSQREVAKLTGLSRDTIRKHGVNDGS